MSKREIEYDVLVAGELNPDLILSDPGLMINFGQQEELVKDAVLTIGSSSAIYSCGIAKLGLRAAFIGVVGDDEFGNFMIDSLSKKNVDISPVIVDRKLSTGISVILNRGEDRSILTYLGAIDALYANQITDDLLKKSNHLHVASYFLQNNLRPGLVDLFNRAKDIGLSISLDTNWDPKENWQGLEEIIPKVDIFFPNLHELQSITKRQNIEKAILEINKMVPIVAVKLGSQGAIASAGGKTLHIYPPTINQKRDAVGAGDSFDAGFTYGFLRGWSLEKTLKLAVTCGSLSLRGNGGTEAQPSLEEAMEYVDF